MLISKRKCVEIVISDQQNVVSILGLTMLSRHKIAKRGQENQIGLLSMSVFYQLCVIHKDSCIFLNVKSNYQLELFFLLDLS